MRTDGDEDENITGEEDEETIKEIFNNRDQNLESTKII